MSERADALLKMSGLHEVLIAFLERGDVLFALTNQTLLYQDASGTRRVTLRDLTRIHSDQDGTLRVETPAGTALTASLVGFDPVDVQTFFGQVRDTTARVKQFPATPSTSTASIPTPGKPAMQPSPVAAPLGSTPPSAPTSESSDFQESVKIIRAGANSVNQSAANQTQITPPPPRPSRTPTQIVPPAAPSTEVREIRRNETRIEEVRNPTLITTPPTPRPQQPAVAQPAVAQPTAAQPQLPQTPAQTPPPAPSAAPAAAQVKVVAKRTQHTETALPEPQLARPAEPEVAAPQVTVPEAAEATPALRQPVSAVGALATLAAHAEATRAWVSRLRFMAVLMLLAALALAYLQFSNGQGLSGVWVLIAGGMSAVGLYALADLTRLLTSLSSAVSAEGGVMDVD